MRISDWGSDVCSSDLEDAAGEEIPAAVDRGDAAITTSDLTIDDAGEQDGEEEAAMRGPTPVAPAQRVEGETWGEIGRSSCRGRVWQYGWRSGVDVALTEEMITKTKTPNRKYSQ